MNENIIIMNDVPFNLEVPTKSESSKFINNERRNGDAKRSFKHVIPKVNDALAIS